MITPPVPGTGRGGARPGAGRPRKQPGDASTPTQLANARYAEQRARYEKLKGDEKELNLAILAGQYVPRDAVRRASATVIAELASALRGIGDLCEMRGLDVEWARKIDDIVDASLNTAAEALRQHCETGKTAVFSDAE